MRTIVALLGIGLAAEASGQSTRTILIAPAYQMWRFD